MWIPSKLTRPGRLHNAIVRPRVLDLLQQAPYYKLVLFRSPAGYGKTTMAAQWLSDKPNVGWYSIDDSDNDGFRFVNYLLQALNKATNFSCSNAQKLAEKRQISSLRSLFSEVFAEMADFHQECYVVLDDYHLITNDEIHESIAFLPQAHARQFNGCRHQPCSAASGHGKLACARFNDRNRQRNVGV